MSNQKYVDEIMDMFNEGLYDGESEDLEVRKEVTRIIRQAKLDVLEVLYEYRQAIKMYNGGFENVVILPYIEELINKLKDKLKEGK